MKGTSSDVIYIMGVHHLADKDHLVKNTSNLYLSESSPVIHDATMNLYSYTYGINKYLICKVCK